jgi:aldehyde:ferredoxin oxidoreductase
MLGGYNSKILRVNLTSRTISVDEPDELFCRKYLGGAGFIAYFLWKEMKGGVDPLGPDNKLIFAAGPVTGIALPGSGRHCVGAKSPLTGAFAKSEAGGFWGAELKRSGYDAIIIEGQADKPVYLFIKDGKASIHDAGHLWGKNTKETQQTIRSEQGDDKIQVSQIGPGGENLVRYACIMSGLFDSVGRGGLGAVMGSKKLKAIAIRGRKALKVANPEVIKEFRQWVLANMDASPMLGSMRKYGTGVTMELFESLGNLPVRNFRDGAFPTAGQISSTLLMDTMGVGMDSCFACPVRCKKAISSQEPYTIDSAYGGPEYETLSALGSNCGIDNLAAIAKGGELCNAYSLDTMSTGCVIAFAMECFENGLLNTNDTNGIELKFGNAEAMLQTIELIARREGIGKLLSEGTARAAEKIGNGAENFALNVKGLEVAQHEPRIKPAMGLGYMVNPHGADHCTNMQDSMYVTEPQLKELRPLGIVEPFPNDYIGPRKVGLLKFIQGNRLVIDSLVTCSFIPYSYRQIPSILSAVTGWETNVMEQNIVGERILTLARSFNAREGFSPDNDKLPVRFFQPKTDGAVAEKHLDPDKMEKAKRYYYTIMGWDVNTGVPLPEKLEELGIPMPD